MESTNTIFRVPNNEEGRLFIALAKKYLNKNDYHFKLRGRTPNHKKLAKDKKKSSQFIASLPVKYADNISIYLMTEVDGYGGAVDKVCVSKQNVIALRMARKDLYELWQGRRENAALITQLKDLRDYLNDLIVKKGKEI